MSEQPSLEFSKSKAAAGLSPGARRLHLAILTRFAGTGTPPSAAELAAAASASGVDVEAATAELAERDVVVFDEAGEISCAYPFSVAATRHQVSWDAGRRSTRCAVDALGMSAMLGRPVTITSVDPTSGSAIVVEVDGDTARWDPETAVVLAGSTGDSCCTSAERACGFINFFATAEVAEAWLAEHPRISGSVLEQQQALDHAISGFGELLRADVDREPAS